MSANSRYDTGRSVSARSVRSGTVQLYATAGALWGAMLATQYVAACLRYHSHLGPWLYRAGPQTQAHLAAAVVVCLFFALAMLPMHRWRWTAVPLVFAALTARIVRTGAVYSPERVFVWYAAYHGVTSYRHMFFLAWLIVGIVALTITVAALRLGESDRRPDLRWQPTPRALRRLPPMLPTRVSGLPPWHLTAAALLSGDGPPDDPSAEMPVPGEAGASAGQTHQSHIVLPG
jgi:hypothetical protein